MKKLLVLFCLMTLLVGCSNPNKTPSTNEKTLRILAPKGATALAFLDVIKEDKHQVSLVDGTDLITTAFVNPTSEYEIIIAPSNMGAKLIEAGKTDYKMLGVLTWGNLYLVGEKGTLEQPGTIAAFGEGAVPQKIFDQVNQNLNLKQTVEYYNSSADVQMQILSKKANIGLIAEPAASATIAKAKEQGIELQILMDLQEEWKQTTQSEGYPQAAIFVLSSEYENNKEGVDNLIMSINSYIEKTNNSEDKKALIEDINFIKPENLGVPSGELTAKTWSNLNIHYKAGFEVIEELKIFLKLFKIEKINELLLK